MTSDVFEWDKTHYETNAHLSELLTDVLQEYVSFWGEVFNTQELKRKMINVKIHWGNRVNFKKHGHYDIINNDIMICKQMKYTPAYVIKRTIFHELLHIKYQGNGKKGSKKHTKEFRTLERKYKDFDKSKEFSQGLAQEIFGYGMDRINGNINAKPKSRAVKQPKPKTENLMDAMSRALGEIIGDEFDLKF
jgi:hypothetical protein